ncbi:hypothetical protein HG536_0A02980 [Torulaspora globosa]|uniref:RRM Nup35-type domain-containing protein n=1 Tax=Torulaspora globosa TaxID=48254 RepID=A0A7G3ZAE5_9SACH|nr:uncharacterized protein HG536_0A02980 [Torulaspora globosa]QLL30481.1 hypothetical protein HG536_0A02980 [Torulaspora globosa]
MFGTNSQPSTSSDRFANLTVNFNQQQQQPQPQQQPNQASTYTSQQFQSVPQTQQQAFFSQGSQNQLGSSQREAEWYNNPRKRAIPQAIVKRTTKRSPSVDPSQAVTDSNASTQRSGFNSLSFGSKKDIRGLPSTQSIKTGKSGEHNTSILSSNEAPPTVSLYDWQREDDFGAMVPLGSQIGSELGKPSSEEKTESLPSSISAARKDGTQPNVFDRNSILESSRSGVNKIDKNGALSPTAPSIEESAVIVFGYPESISNLVIRHFSKFGSILEDFEVLRNSSGINAASLRLRRRKSDNFEKKYPIFTGDGWVKLTYDSSSAAVRALQENGQVFGGSLIGCVPYNKNLVEQLASCKIEKMDDIGGVNFSVKQSSLDESIENPLSSSASPLSGERDEQIIGTRTPLGGSSNQVSASGNILEHPKITYLNRRLHLKDGKKLFAHSGSPGSNNFLQNLELKMRQQEESNKQQAGLLSKVNNWLFGWNEL